MARCRNISMDYQVKVGRGRVITPRASTLHITTYVIGSMRFVSMTFCVNKKMDLVTVIVIILVSDLLFRCCC